MKRLILLGGPMGVGKTTAARCLNRLLPRSVMLDGDWCWMMDPFVVNEETQEMVLENITALLRNFLRCSQLDHVILSWVMDRPEIVQALLERLNGESFRLTHLSLVCSPQELRRRLEKDVAAGLREKAVIPRRLARLPLYAGAGGRLLPVDGLTPEETARQIARWVEEEG